VQGTKESSRKTAVGYGKKESYEFVEKKDIRSAEDCRDLEK